jgi:hypothetical protein
MTVTAIPLAFNPAGLQTEQPAADDDRASARGRLPEHGFDIVQIAEGDDAGKVGAVDRYHDRR